MGMYVTMQQHPKFSLAVLAAAVVAVIAWVVVYARSAPPTNVEVSGTAWFSTDDGQTCFKDDQYKVPPFDHRGRPACRAYVFTCDSGKTTFVAYLERYTPEAQRRLKEMRASKHPPEFGEIQRIVNGGVEVKKPGAGQWTKTTDPQAIKIRQPSCPDKPGVRPQPVLP